MPKVVDASRQRREIRQAAYRVFARRGVTGTGLSHVAAAAGMGRSSLYHYYPDKASLLRDIIKEVLKEEESLFAAAATGAGSPRERILGLMVTLASFFEAWSAVGRMLFDLRLRDARGFRPFFRRVRGYLASLIEEGQRGGEIDPGLDPHLGAAVLIGAVDGLLLQQFVDPKAFPEAAGLGDALVNAVKKVLVP